MKINFSNFLKSFLLLFLIYIFLTFPVDLQEILADILIVTLIMILFYNFSTFFSSTTSFFKFIFYLFSYLFFLLLEIVKANLNVAKIVLSPKIKINSAILKCKTNLKSDFGKSILANSITLTPGTLSVDVNGDDLFIHCMDTKIKSEEEAYQNIVKPFEQRIKRFAL